MAASLEQKYGSENTGDRKDVVRKRHMEMSKERGEQAARLRLKHEELIQEKGKLEQDLSKFKRKLYKTYPMEYI
jgi:hypothetical protein